MPRHEHIARSHQLQQRRPQPAVDPFRRAGRLHARAAAVPPRPGPTLRITRTSPSSRPNGSSAETKTTDRKPAVSAHPAAVARSAVPRPAAIPTTGPTTGSAANPRISSRCFDRNPPPAETASGSTRIGNRLVNPRERLPRNPRAHVRLIELLPNHRPPGRQLHQIPVRARQHAGRRERRSEHRQPVAPLHPTIRRPARPSSARVSTIAARSRQILRISQTDQLLLVRQEVSARPAAASTHSSSAARSSCPGRAPAAASTAATPRVQHTVHPSRSNPPVLPDPSRPVNFAADILTSGSELTFSNTRRVPPAGHPNPRHPPCNTRTAPPVKPPIRKNPFKFNGFSLAKPILHPHKLPLP